MNLRVPVVLVVVAVTAAGCVESASQLYVKREKFLDQVTGDGITYRGQLQQQGSQPSAQNCLIGYNLRAYRADEIPEAPPDSGLSEKNSKTWSQQIQEAYIKGCLTGKPRPKPEESGINAVTPVPISASPSVPASVPPSR